MALTDNQETKLIPDFTRWEQAVASGTIHFYKNAICNFNTSGYVKLGDNVGGDTFAGIALEELDQATGGSNGDNDIKLIPAKSGEVVLLTLTGVTVADLGVDVFVNGDDVVATTGLVRAGSIVALGDNANECYVKLN